MVLEIESVVVTPDEDDGKSKVELTLLNEGEEHLLTFVGHLGVNLNLHPDGGFYLSMSCNSKAQEVF